LLLGIGCEIGQGWLFARAMPEAELIPWLSSFSAVPA